MSVTGIAKSNICSIHSNMCVVRRFYSSGMKLSNPFSIPSIRRDSHPGTAAIAGATEIADHIRWHEAETVDAMASLIHHPRSLARPVPDWRPPSKQTPALFGSHPLMLTITRHRVGPRARARVRGFGETRDPAYLVSVRVTDPRGRRVDPVIAEGWVRALVDEEIVDAVHEVTDGRTPTFVWLVDGRYQPVHSPASLFTGFAQAA